jgi:hypothetical protein
MTLSIEAARLLRHLERTMRKKVNDDNCPDNRHDLLTHSWTNTRLARDAGIHVDHLQRSRQQLTDAGLIYPVTGMAFKRGKRASSRARVARHKFTLKIQK